MRDVINLLKKEMKLTASPLSYFFLAFSLMVMIPNYPLTMGAFFVCFGIFQTYQTMRDNNDIVYSALLPIAKRDVVKAKYLFAVAIQLCGFVLMAILAVLRLTALRGVTVYAEHTLLHPNLCFLGFVFVIYGIFNLIFLRGFFKTGYYFGKPFIFFIAAAMLAIGAIEVLPHLPGCGWLNTFGFGNLGKQIIVLLGGIVFYAVVTLLSFRSAKKHFDRIDL